MYSIYKITNLVNGKNYIGSTNDVDRRWREHKSHALNDKQPDYNYPLQRAFRKYGFDNFYFEILSTGYNTREEMENDEHEAIIKYNSLVPNGYNQTVETHNGLTDEKIRETLKTRIIAINLDNPEETIIYSSVSEASRILNVDRSCIHACIRGSNRYTHIKGYILRRLDENNEIVEPTLTVQEVIEEYNRTNPIINGERHSITEWLKIIGLSKPSYYARIKKGMTPIEALTKPKKKGC